MRDRRSPEAMSDERRNGQPPDLSVTRMLAAQDSILQELARISGERAKLACLRQVQERDARDIRVRLEYLEKVSAHATVSLQRSLDQTTTAQGLDFLERASARPEIAADMSAIGVSGLFDVDFYLRSVPTLRHDRAIVHYVCFGAALGLDPHPIFSTNFYLARYPDVRRSGENPFAHFLRQPAKAPTDPHPLFDCRYYLDCSPDILKADEHPLKHYLSWGWQENRDPSPNFSTRRYLAENRDILQAGRNPLEHYIVHGRFEGRVAWPADPPASPRRRASIGNRSALLRQPLISVIVPMYNTEPHWATDCVDSILGQSYKNIELILIDDASPKPIVRAFMESFARRDARVRTIFSQTNGGIAGATNAGLEVAAGEYVAFVDHDDVLSPDALELCVREFVRHADCDVIYTDHTLEAEDGTVIEIVRKPQWSPVMFMGVMYLAHLVIVRRACILEAGCLDATFDGVQDFEFELRLSRVTPRFRRLDRPLYAWRAVPGSIAAGTDNKPHASQRQVTAVQAHLDALKIEGIVVPNRHCPHRVSFAPRDERESVADILFVLAGNPVRDSNSELQSALRRRTSLEEGVKIIGPSNGSLDPSCAKDLRRLIEWRVDAEFVAFLPAHVEFDTSNWLATLLLHLSLPSVGMVSPILVAHDRVVAAGRSFRRNGSLIDLFAGEWPFADGHIGMLSCAREVSLPSPGIGIVRRSDLIDLDLEMWGDLQSTIDDIGLQLGARKRHAVVVPSVRATVGSPTFDSHGPKRFASRSLFDALLVDKWRATVEAGDPFWPEPGI